MEIALYIGLGLLLGAALGYFLGKGALNKLNTQKAQELEKQTKDILDKAKENASRKIQDAKKQIDSKLRDARNKAKNILRNAERDAETAKKKRMAEAKEHFLQKKANFEENTNNRLKKVKDAEAVLKENENALKNMQKDLKRKEAKVNSLQEKLEGELQAINGKEEEVETQRREYTKNLERVAKFTAQEAKEELLKNMKDKADAEAITYIKDRVSEAQVTANKEAKKIVIQSIQRMAAEHTIENTVSVFRLDSDDLKGQIIGREGRNIRALEAATGVEIIVDDTPEAIIISSFDPIRREVCRLSLQRLVADGRIHPARIEEIVAKTKKQLNEQIMEIGQRTVIELNIYGIQAPLIRMIGRMRFRSSYGQNLLKHSIETAKLCAIMSAELGLTPREIKLAKRAGLLHDIGKVAEEETELSHAIIGMKLCERHGEKAAVVNAVGAHHDEVEMKYIIAPIVQACDAISGARPGARREILESYIQRIHDLENIAMNHDGVQKVYAMQAGRELRVIVESEKVSDERAEDLSFQISQKIQNEMQYPGQIKVTVIREKRAVSFAR